MSPLYQLLCTTDDWTTKYQLLIEAGKQLPLIDNVEKIEANKVEGCLSPTWIIVKNDNDKVIISGYSKSQIITGLIALLAEEAEYSTRAKISTWKLRDFEGLGLSELITVSRVNGFNQILILIQSKLAV